MPDSYTDAPSSAGRGWQIRRLALADLEGLMRVQEACYGLGYMESQEIYRARLASNAQRSLVAVQGDVVLGYLAAYHSNLGCITPLHGHFSASAEPDTLYLHDMAVSPECAGQGLASALFSAMLQEAQAWTPRYSALVSVQGSQGYWEHKGYTQYTSLTPEQANALRSYGEDAVYMTQAYV